MKIGPSTSIQGREDESRSLERLLAESIPDNAALKGLLSKKQARCEARAFASSILQR